MTISDVSLNGGNPDVRNTKDDAPQGVEGVKSAVRVLAVISLLTTEPNGATFGDICQRLELPKSSMHALLRTMTDQGFLTLDQSTRNYHIGIRLWEAGETYVHGFDLPRIARPFMEAARDALRETVQLAILDGIENVYIAKVEADQRLSLQSRVGSRLPAFATGLGKVLLSGLSDDEVNRRYDGVNLEGFTEKSITNIERLLEVIGEIRANGFGVDDGEYTPGVVCTAVPIWEHSGEIFAAMSVSIPEVRLTPDLQRHAREVLFQQAGALSVALGHNGRGVS